jgi:hypothetical protein
MSTTLDGLRLFDESRLQIEAGSFKRDSIERAGPMLDGIISIDLGRRSRTVTQTGLIRAKSRTDLNRKILAISDFIDGNVHTFVADGIQYQNLRMDSFRLTGEQADGTGILADYEINYTQLA